MTKIRFGLIVLSLVAAVGCGDSGSTEEGTTTGGDSSTTGDPSATTGDPSATTGDPSATTGDPSATTGDPSATTGDPNATTGDPSGDGGGACSNQQVNVIDDTKACATAEAISAFQCIADPAKTAGDCGQSCAIDSDKTACNRDCYAKDPEFKDLPTGCRDCWADITTCVTEECVIGVGGLPTGPCFTDAMGAACTTCQATKCNPAFEACSGVSTQM